ncbi:MAG TPA: glycosyltransferase, partial [Kineosporiaceae bacterium]|nr:glycosyltransferase [Kineosporiaceae bacterium]
TQALVTGLSTLGAEVDVVRVVDEPQPLVPAGVAHHLVNGAPGAADDAAVVLNSYDVVVLQHEYGIYGGADGDEVLDLLALVEIPVITVLHTVLAVPTPRQRQILQSVVAASDALVTMTHTAQHRVIDSYGADPAKVHVIPHGAADDLVSGTRPRRVHERDEVHQRPARPAVAKRRPFILTWGLLGVGKGIEWGIEALSTLQDLDPSPVYIVAGQTHPRVLEREGEAYRQGLRSAAIALGVSDDVIFDDRYLDAAQLHRLVRAADVVLLPYDSREQVTSGVLIEAVAAGRPVVSSRFPHAVELLGDGAGLLVEQRDPAAIGAAVRRVLTEPGLAGRMTRRAVQLAPDLSWRAVAGRYLATGSALSRGQAVPSDVDPIDGDSVAPMAVVA